MNTKAYSLSTLLALCMLWWTLTLRVQAQSPGAYSTGLRLWLKASAGAYSDAGTTLCTNGTTVRQWNDFSGNGLNAAQATASLRPTWNSSGANGNPVLNFAGTHFMDVPGTSISGTGDYFGFFVVKLTSATAGGTTDGNGTYIIDRTTATNNLYSMKVVASGGTNRFFYQKRNDSGGNLGGATSTTVVDPAGFQLVSMGRVYNSSSNSLSRIYVNGVLEATQSNASETTSPPNMRIGRHATNTSGGIVGDLTEVIVYNNIPPATDFQKINSYLAIKYGFSVYQYTLTNYLSSAGTVIYPAATTHSDYVTCITGIGQDNGSALVQSNSKNQSTNDFVRMQNPSALSNGDFLVWGSNNGTMMTPNTSDVDGTSVLRRLSRVWRVAHTGNLGTVDVSIDLSTVPGTKNQADLRLLIDRDGDGFFDNDVSPLTGTLTGNTFSVAGISFQDGDYFTIGSTSPGTTPLPIELTTFYSNCLDGQVSVKWTTASEKENAYFVLEESLNGRNWTDVAHVTGAGNTSSQNSYEVVLNADKETTRYYRLTQVDFSGDTKTFPVISSDCSTTSGDWDIYPNPANKEVSITLFVSDYHTEATLRVYNALGNCVYLKQLNLPDGLQHITLPKLEAGPYTMYLESAHLKLSPKKLLIQ